MQNDIERTLFHEQTILRRLDELASQITADYEGRELTVLALLNGSIFFMADLLRRTPYRYTRVPGEAAEDTQVRWALDLKHVPEETAHVGADVGVIITDHKVFNYAAMVDRFPLLVDTRNALKGVTKSTVFRLYTRP